MHEHSGKSSRTGKMISCPSHSSILDHSIICKTKIEFSIFKILDQVSCKFSWRILESLFNKEKPNLNEYLFVVR